MPDRDEQWRALAKGLLKAEIKREGLTYQELAERLTAMGVEMAPENISNKISRGKFSTVFFLQCLDAVGCRTLRLDRD